MALKRLFGRGKEKQKLQAPEQKMSGLEELATGDTETYQALVQTMFLDPRKIETPSREVIENAKKGEREGDKVKAAMWYEIAGGLAIFEGNVKKVVECYGEAQRVSGRKYLILKNPEKAVAVAQEYYKKASII